MAVAYSPDMPARVIALMAQGLSGAAVCGVFGVPRSTMYGYEKRHPDLRLAFRIGQMKRALFWERALIFQAEQGRGRSAARAVIMALRWTVRECWAGSGFNADGSRAGTPAALRWKGGKRSIIRAAAEHHVEQRREQQHVAPAIMPAKPLVRSTPATAEAHRAQRRVNPRAVPRTAPRASSARRRPMPQPVDMLAIARELRARRAAA